MPPQAFESPSSLWREWSKPSVVIALLMMLLGGATAWATLGSRVCDQNEDIARVEKSVEAAMPREVAEQRFDAIDKDLSHMQGQLDRIAERVGAK